jgi:predicted phage terminase large subunit-like protein
MYFTKDMFRLVNCVPSPTQLNLFCAWDLAIGEKQSNDYTVGVVGGLDWMGQLNIVEIIRFRGDAHFIADAILNTYKKYPSIQQIGIEQGAIQMAIMPTLSQLMKERRMYPSLDNSLRPITDKQARARPLQGMMQQGRVIFPSTQLWFEDAKLELLRFPGGLHDDIVDALAWLAHMVVSAKPPAKPGTEQKQKSWKHKLNKYLAAGNRTGCMGA